VQPVLTDRIIIEVNTMNIENINKIKSVLESVGNRNFIGENVEDINKKTQEMKDSITTTFIELQKMCAELNKSDLAKYTIEVLEESKSQYSSGRTYKLTANHNGWGYISAGSTPGHQSSTMCFSEFIRDVLVDDIKWLQLKKENTTRKRVMQYLNSLESIKMELVELEKHSQTLKKYNDKSTRVHTLKDIFYVDKNGKTGTALGVKVRWYTTTIDYIREKESDDDDDASTYNRNRSDAEDTDSASALFLCSMYQEELETFFDVEHENACCEQEQTEYLVKRVQDEFAVYYLAKTLTTSGGN